MVIGPESSRGRIQGRWSPAVWSCCLIICFCLRAQAGPNLLDNPGFEEPESGASKSIPHWSAVSVDQPVATLSPSQARTGRQCASLPANAAIEQQITTVVAGAYLVHCWVKSETEQPVTILLQNPQRPWMAYSYAEIKVPKNQWTQLEAFCAVDEPGPLSVTIGGMSAEFRKYHGTAGELTSALSVDDCELVRFDRTPPPAPVIWDSGSEQKQWDWAARVGGVVVESANILSKERRSFRTVSLPAQFAPAMARSCFTPWMDQRLSLGACWFPAGFGGCDLRADPSWRQNGAGD